MRILDVFVHRARERAHRLAASLFVIRLWPLTIAVIAGLLVSTLGTSAPVRAEPPPDPVARLQVILKSVHINSNDVNHSVGQVFLSSGFCIAPAPTEPKYPHLCPAGSYLNWRYDFTAKTGDDVALERWAPQDQDNKSADITVAAGIPVYSGEHRAFMTQLWDLTTIGTAEPLGLIVRPVDEEHNWGIGTFTITSAPLNDAEGEYVLTYEIRRMPLPDLRVNGFQVAGSPGSEYVCGQIQNAGQASTGPVPLALVTEGVTLQTVTLDPFGIGESAWHCVLRADLPAKAHNLVFSVDPSRVVPEMDEYNNVNVVAVAANASGTAQARPIPSDPGAAPSTTAPDAMPSPQPKPTETSSKPGADKADLLVRAIRINGQAPDGKGDCQAGKNGVTVTVKNAGKADSGSFTVRLSVDGDTLDQSVDALRAGAERKVSFDNLTLKKGQHTLRAVADPNHAVGQANDDGNELKVTVRCTDAG